MRIGRTLFVAAALAGFTLGATVTVPVHAADVAVSFDAGNVAFAYNDGYWDKDHQWHTWHNAKEKSDFRVAHKDTYHDWKHDRDADKGWHDTAAHHD